MAQELFLILHENNTKIIGKFQTIMCLQQLLPECLKKLNTLPPIPLLSFLFLIINNKTSMGSKFTGTQILHIQ